MRYAITSSLECLTRIVLIDGDELVGKMIDHDIGVSLVAQYEVKRVDSDYFTEESWESGSNRA